MSKLWAGERNDSKMLWVYDPDVPHPDPDMVYLYNAKTGRMKGYKKTFARRMLQKVTGRRANEAFEKYKKWKATPEADDFIKSNREEYLEKRQEKLDETKRRHSEHLKKNGKDNKGASVSTKRPRVTHCWACKEPLKSGSFLECNSCHGLICYCGACLCGHTPVPS